MMTKKWLLRIAGMLGVCMASLLVATPAMAMWSWCECDPVLNIEGHTVSVTASIEGDPAQIRGDIDFYISVPKGTDISLIFTEPNASVKIGYNSSYNSNRGDDNDCFSPRRSDGIPVLVTADVDSRTKFNTRLTVTVDGVQVAQDEGTTRGKLSCGFTIQ